jgi:hypothetical protein
MRLRAGDRIAALVPLHDNTPDDRHAERTLVNLPVIDDRVCHAASLSVRCTLRGFSFAGDRDQRLVHAGVGGTQHCLGRRLGRTLTGWLHLLRQIQLDKKSSAVERWSAVAPFTGLLAVLTVWPMGVKK